MKSSGEIDGRLEDDDIFVMRADEIGIRIR